MIIEHKDFKISYFSTEQKEKIETFLSLLRDNSKSISCKTSGSTGSPKVIELSKKALMASAQNSIDFFKLNPKQSAILCMSVDFIAGKMMLVRAMVAGLDLKVLPVSSDLSMLIEPADFIALFPKQLRGLLETSNGIKILKDSERVLVGGAPIPSEIEGVLKSNKISIYQSYGMTETATHVALKRAGYQAEDLYRAINGVSFGTKNGCLVIDYPTVLAEAITTNDLVELTDAVTFKWLGRADFVINTGGFKVSPEQLEAKLSSVLKCLFIVTGITDDEFGERIGLIIKGAIPAVDIQKETFKKTLHTFEIPKSYVCINEFSQTSNGKIDRIKTAAKIKDGAWKNIL